jgi:hypothetical protein
MLLNVHTKFLTYQYIQLNIFRLDCPVNTSLQRNCHFSDTPDLAKVYKLTVTSRPTSKPVAYIDAITIASTPRHSASRIQADGQNTVQLRQLDISPLIRSGDNSTYTTHHLRFIDHLLELTQSPGSFPSMELSVPNANVPRAQPAQPHHTTTQPPDVK